MWPLKECGSRASALLFQVRDYRVLTNLKSGLIEFMTHYLTLPERDILGYHTVIRKRWYALGARVGCSLTTCTGPLCFHSASHRKLEPTRASGSHPASVVSAPLPEIGEDGDMSHASTGSSSTITRLPPVTLVWYLSAIARESIRPALIRHQQQAGSALARV